MAIEKVRFDQIMAVVLANLVDDFQGLAGVPLMDTVHGNDVSDYGGTAGCLLAGAGVNWNEMEEFADEFTSRFKTGEVSPQIAKILVKNDANIQIVIEDIIKRAEKFGFTPTEDTAKDLVNESASQLEIFLCYEEQKRASEMLLEQMRPTFLPALTKYSPSPEQRRG